MTTPTMSRSPAPRGKSCVGIRKNGPTNPQGTRWVLYATRCVPPGEPVTDRDIDRFVRDARLRE